MRRRLVLLLTLAVCGMATAAAAGDADNDRIIFGSDIGTGKAYACFRRVYDTAHLKQHPKQNVTAMTLLVASTVDPEQGRQYSTAIGVKFRHASTEFQTGSGCQTGGDNESALNCPIDCDGGTIDVRLRDAGSIYVSIPYGALTWDPAKPDDEPSEQSRFGSDDKLFRLDRVAVSDCLPLADDDAEKADMRAAP